MNTPKAYRWDYEESPWDSNNAALTFSVGVFQWLPKASGNGLKKSKTIRIKGFVAESGRVYDKARQLCEKLNKEGVLADSPPSWLQKQYSLPKPSALANETATDDLNPTRRTSRKKALLAAFAPDLKRAGFKKKGATWHRMNVETIEVFNVQCSQWSEKYYFNAGIYLRGLGSRATPLVSECHIFGRIPNLKSHGRSEWDRHSKLSSFDPPPIWSFEWLDLDPETRICELKKLIVPLALDWLGRLRELEDIEHEIRSRPEQVCSIKKGVYQMLGIAPPPGKNTADDHDGDEPPPHIPPD